jgi:hypothetical protein
MSPDFRRKAANLQLAKRRTCEANLQNDEDVSPRPKHEARESPQLRALQPSPVNHVR